MTKAHPSERRLYPRIPVNLPGELQANGKDIFPCRIRDLCQDGLLFECGIADDELVKIPGTSTLIRFWLPKQNGQDLIQAWIQVLQRGDGLFGARFLRPNTSVIATIIAYIKAPKPVNESKGSVLGGAEQTARTILRRITLRCIEDLTKSILASMQGALLEANNHATNDAERGNLTIDIANLERSIQQGRFQERLWRELTSNILKKDNEIAQLQTDKINSDISLVDQDRFEQWLAVSALIERLERKLGETLGPLRTLSKDIFGAETILSVEPQGLANGLWQTLAATGLTTLGQLICLRAVVKPLPASLGIYYKTISDAWMNAGFTSHAMPKIRSTPAPAPTPDTANVKSPVNAKISSQPTEKPQRSTEPSNISDSELSNLLLTENSQSATSQTLQERIKALLFKDGAVNPNLLTPILSERVNTSSDVLTRMVKDQALPEQAKKLIENLSMHVMAAAVTEPGFFTTAKHPLTSILDQLEHLAMFLPHEGIAKTPTQRAIELLMQKALTTNPKNRSALNALSQHLHELQQRLGDEWLENAEQVLVNCEAKERIRAARRHVRNRINEIFADCAMHPAIAELMRQAWRILLQLTWIREGGEKIQWQRHWQTILKLHNICSTGDPTLTEGQIMLLLKELREGLDATGIDPYRRTLICEQVEEALLAARLGKVDVQETFKALPQDPDEIREQDEIPSLESHDQHWIKALATVDTLETGYSLQLRQGNSKQYWLLVWRSGNGRELVFVDPGTLQSKTWERMALAQAIRDELVQISAPITKSLTNRTTEIALQEMQQRIHYHETHDTLTGLHNRRQLDGIITKLITDLRNVPISQAEKRIQVLGFLDLDKFEAMTGIGGYSVGERIITTVARLLQKHLRPEKTTCLAYLGGSRFAFLMPAQDETTATSLGTGICDSVAKMAFYWRGKAYPLSCSIGLVMLSPEVKDSETLLSAVDTTCMAVQRAGGGRAVLFQEGNADIFQHQKRMHDWMQADGVVKGKRLRLRGQRIAATTDPVDSPHHYEILLSVYDEHGEMLPLDAFIAAAETFNLMAEIDKLVLNRALQWVQAHPSQAQALGGIAINLSGQSLGDKRLIGIIADSLRNMAISPKLISFEVTETTAIANLDQAAAIINGIKAIGCDFALDDFGAGLSSYSYLKRLPVDYIKIDGSFIKDLLVNPNDQIIVKSINEVAHFMGKKTIAEYVENAELLEKLREMGVDYVQGYAIGKPQFLDEV